MAWIQSRYWLWLASGFLLGIGFIVPLLWPVGIVGIIFFLYLLQQDAPLKEKLLGAWLAWSIKASLSVGWIWSVYPIGWLPEDVGFIQLVFVFSSWFATAVCLGFGGLVVVLVTEVLKKLTEIPRWAYYSVLYPLTWVLGEVIGSVMSAIFFYGTGGSIVAGFSFGYMGYQLAEHAWFLQFAKVAGVYGLSFLVVCIAGTLLLFGGSLLRNKRVALACVISVYLIGFVAPLQADKSENLEGSTVLTIDTQFGSRLGSADLGQKQTRDQLEEAVRRAIAREPEYIVLPEDSRYFNQVQSLGVTKSLFNIKHNNPEVIIIDSGRMEHDSKTVLQSFVLNSSENSVDRFHKRLLVPQGEYISTVYEKLIKWSGYGEFLDFYTRGLSYEIGPWTNQSSGSKKSPGILFCFESFDPQGVRTLTKERPDMPFVAHIASHAWFHEPKTLWSQMETMLRVQAVWNQHYIVSVGNMMPGRVYLPNGEMINPELVEKGERWEIKQFIIPQ